MKANDPKLAVLERLHGMALMIRRRGTPEEATEALPYEQMLERDIKARQAELHAQAQLPLEPAKAA